MWCCIIGVINMKEEDDFLKKMENLNVPEVNPEGHPKEVKMAIMNAERSAALGFWLVAVPCYFLACVFIYYFFNRQVSWFGAMFKLAEGLDKTPGIDFMAPIVLVVLPIVCIIINALAITHVHYRKRHIRQAGRTGIYDHYKNKNVEHRVDTDQYGHCFYVHRVYHGGEYLCEVKGKRLKAKGKRLGFALINRIKANY